MRILISVINYRFLTGAELYVYELSKQLRALGHDVLITSRITGGEITEKSRAEGIEVYDFIDCPSNWKPDVLHLNEKWPSAFALSLYPDTPAVATIHSQYPIEAPFISPRISRYICIRPEIQEVAQKRYGIDPDRTTVIYNGVDFNRFKASKEKPKKRKVLFVGTIDPLREKAILDLIKKSQKENFSVRIVGEKHAHYLDDPPKNVELLPSTWHVEEYLKDATETAGILLGRTTIEGWAAGKPGWIYDVDLLGNIKDVQIFQPPKDLVERFDITNVADKIVAEYKKAVKTYKYNSKNNIIESMQANAVAVGLSSAHEYHLHGFNALIGKHEQDIIMMSEYRLGLEDQVRIIQERQAHIRSDLDKIVKSRAWRMVSGMRRLTRKLRRK